MSQVNVLTQYVNVWADITGQEVKECQWNLIITEYNAVYKNKHDQKHVQSQQIY